MAGHPAPLLLRPGERAPPLGRPQPLLGIAPDRLWLTDAAALHPGDTLLLYTDGVTDTPGPDERFGAARLVDTASAAAAEPASLVAHIEATLGSRQRRSGTVDDRALLAVQYLGVWIREGVTPAAVGVRPNCRLTAWRRMSA